MLTASELKTTRAGDSMKLVENQKSLRTQFSIVKLSKQLQFVSKKVIKS